MTTEKEKTEEAMQDIVENGQSTSFDGISVSKPSYGSVAKRADRLLERHNRQNGRKMVNTVGFGGMGYD